MAETADLAHHLLQANRAVEQVMLARLETVGIPGLRMGHLTLLRVLPPDAAVRVSDLAAAAGVTRQAITQLATELAAMGVVEVRVDETDRRARTVSYTEYGRSGYHLAMQAFSGIEVDLAASLGERRLAGLKRALHDVAAAAQHQLGD